MGKDPQYKLRGHMVKHRTLDEIATVAVMQFLELSRVTAGQLNIESFIDYLATQDIEVQVLETKTWNNKYPLTRGYSIPNKGKILLPYKLFRGAKKNNSEDWETFFHELGHVALKHEPVYLKADENRAIEPLDDAETQADFFAHTMMSLFKLSKNTTSYPQLKFDF